MSVERRREVRHKICTPAYASIAGGSGGPIVDASEHGIALQSELPISPKRITDVRLDLLESRSSLATPARVAWTDDQGRAGIELLGLTEESRRRMQEWLVLNGLVGVDMSGQWSEVETSSPESVETRAQQTVTSPLRQAVERALALTRADGAALALADEFGMVCQAAAGEIAPPTGSRLTTDSGLSGACIRMGKLLRCDNALSDPYADRESCLALGISSVLALPITYRGSVIGLMELFSRQACAFTDLHCSAMQSLAESVVHDLQFEESPVESQQVPVPAAVSGSASPQTKAAQRADVPPPIKMDPVSTAAAIAPTNGTSAAVPASKSEFAAAAAAAPSPVPAPTLKVEPAGGPVLLDPEWQAAERSAARKRIAFFACLSVFLAVVLLFGLGGDLPWKWFRLHGKSGQEQLQKPSVPGSVDSAANSAVADAVKIQSYSAEQLRAQATKGDANAQFALGAKYASGEDVRQNYSEAVKWFTQAAEHGHVASAATLGAFYWAGRGVTQDYGSAYMWSTIARVGGDEASKYRVAILRARMNELEIAEAERRASAWLKDHSGQFAVKQDSGEKGTDTQP